MIPSDDTRRRLQNFLQEPQEDAPARNDIPNFGTAGIRIRADRPRLGRYILKRVIGRGGMGTVYEAEDQGLSRTVALKVLREGVADERVIARFHREATILAQLQHPNLVSIFEVGSVASPSEEPTHFIAMQYVEGKSLADLLEEKNTPLGEYLRIMEDVCRVVHFAHSKGIIHRDLKPGNVMVDTSGHVLLMDFGLAHAEFFNTQLTRTNAVMGTPGYMAPEQVTGKSSMISERTDVYGLGIMLYECITGRIPFEGTAPAEVYQRILTEEPEPPSRRLLVKMAPALELICLKAIEKDPSRRYASAELLAEDLARHRRGDDIVARAPTLIYRMSRGIRRRKGVLASTVIVLSALVTVFAILLPRLRQAEVSLESALDEQFSRLREFSTVSLQSALDLRRAGHPEKMEPYAARLKRNCDEVIAKYPKLPEPHYLWGRMLRAQMRFAEALAVQDVALDKDPDYGPALYERVVLTAILHRNRTLQLVGAYSHESDLVATAGASKPMFQRKPNPSTDEYARRDRVAMDLTKRMEADLARLDPMMGRKRPGIDASQVTCARGLMARLKNDIPEARRLLVESIAMAPTLEEGHEALAFLEADQHNFQESIRRWSEGIAQDRGYLPHQVGRGQTHIRWALFEMRSRGDPVLHLEEAVRDFDAARVLMPDRMEALAGRAMASQVMGIAKSRVGENPLRWFESSLEAYNQLIQMDPANEDLRLRRGVLYINRAHSRQKSEPEADEFLRMASADLDEAARLAPQRDDPWVLRHALCMTRAMAAGKDADKARAWRLQAVEACDRALAINPDRKWTWYQRGVSNLMLSNIAIQTEGARMKEAQEDFRKAAEDTELGFDPWGMRCFAKLNACLLAMGNPGESEELFQDLMKDCETGIARYGATADAWAFRAMVHNRYGLTKSKAKEDPGPSYEAAIRDYSRGIELSRDAPDYLPGILSNRASTYLNWGNWKLSLGRDPSPEFHSAMEDYAEAIRLNPKIEAGLTASLAKLEKYFRDNPGK